MTCTVQNRVLLRSLERKAVVGEINTKKGCRENAPASFEEAEQLAGGKDTGSLREEG